MIVKIPCVFSDNRYAVANLLDKAEFNSRKHKLEHDWNAHHSLQWPTEKSRRCQAHHIVPICAGGLNQWWNLSPMTNENHKKLHASTEEHACFSRNFGDCPTKIEKLF
jgi:hypothetical protein